MTISTMDERAFVGTFVGTERGLVRTEAVRVVVRGLPPNKPSRESGTASSWTDDGAAISRVTEVEGLEVAESRRRTDFRFAH